MTQNNLIWVLIVLIALFALVSLYKSCTKPKASSCSSTLPKLAYIRNKGCPACRAFDGRRWMDIQRLFKGTEPMILDSNDEFTRRVMASCKVTSYPTVVLLRDLDKLEGRIVYERGTITI